MKISRTFSALLLALTLLVSAPVALLAQTGQQPGIPARPEELKYTTLTYNPPKRDRYRHVLSNGMVVYAVEDHDLPLVNITTLVRTGSYLDPAGKEGLGSLVGSQMRAGGTAKMTAEQFDEAADFLAAQISSGVGSTQGGANLNLLAKDVDKGLGLYVEMLRTPAFQEDRLKLAKSQILQALERRNDNTSGIEAREWNRLLYGAEHFSSKETTKASIEAITRQDLVDFHQKYFQPAGFIIAASGDFKTDELLAKLEAAFKGWPSNKMAVPDVPKPTQTPVAGIYTVNKPDVNQGRVSIGHIGSMRDTPDSYALEIMNDILGGGSFTSRIMSRVRSDEGLAYSASSAYGMGVYYPGTFRAEFQSKSATTAQAIQIVLDEINRIRTVKVSAEELETSKNQAVETFPLIFSTAGQIAGTFAQDEYTKRPADYWDTYRQRIAAVTADDVQRVAQKYLDPSKLVILVVGNIDDITRGNPDHPEYSLTKLATTGQIRRIPLPDPLTLVYPPAP